MEADPAWTAQLHHEEDGDGVWSNSGRSRRENRSAARRRMLDEDHCQEHRMQAAEMPRQDKMAPEEQQTRALTEEDGSSGVQAAAVQRAAANVQTREQTCRTRLTATTQR